MTTTTTTIADALRAAIELLSSSREWQAASVPVIAEIRARREARRADHAH